MFYSSLGRPALVLSVNLYKKSDWTLIPIALTTATTHLVRFRRHLAIHPNPIWGMVSEWDVFGFTFKLSCVSPTVGVNAIIVGGQVSTRGPRLRPRESRSGNPGNAVPRRRLGRVLRLDRHFLQVWQLLWAVCQSPVARLRENDFTSLSNVAVNH